LFEIHEGVHAIATNFGCHIKVFILIYVFFLRFYCYVFFSYSILYIFNGLLFVYIFKFKHNTLFLTEVYT